MPPKRYAIKGEPDFHTISDERLKSFLDLTQQMIFAYNHHDDAKVEVLKSIWKDLNNEDCDRLARSACEAIDKGENEVSTAPLLKKVPKVRKSPAKRKI